MAKGNKKERSSLQIQSHQIRICFAKNSILETCLNSSSRLFKVTLNIIKQSCHEFNKERRTIYFRAPEFDFRIGIIYISKVPLLITKLELIRQRSIENRMTRTRADDHGLQTSKAFKMKTTD